MKAAVEGIGGEAPLLVEVGRRCILAGAVARGIDQGVHQGLRGVLVLPRPDGVGPVAVALPPPLVPPL